MQALKKVIPGFFLLFLTIFARFGLAQPSVDWQDWSPAAFQQAKAEKKLILLDVNAAWCHWCHVMEETIYHDSAVVTLIKKHFIPIKVDVDARPDIAQRYGPIGWPATAFFSPDARQIREVGAYIEPRTFEKILQEVLDSYARGGWKQTSARTSAPKTSTTKEGTTLSPPPLRPSPGTRLRVDEEVVGAERRKPTGRVRVGGAWTEKELLRYYDPNLGGWGRRQKAPVADAVEHAFWKAYRTGDKAWRKRAFSTLLVQRALLDPVWGGVYQYSVGGGWDKPHFEKIMTVQAGALENYSQAYGASGDKRFLQVARMMVDYFNNFLSAPDGGFYTSQDADVGQTDGNDYFCLSDKERRAIGIPRVDTHVYTRENGLAISAFCKAYAATLDPTILNRALKAADLTVASHGNGRGGLTHAARQNEAIAYLADNAAFGRALIDCYEVTGQVKYLLAAKKTAEFMLRELLAPDKEGFFATTQDPHAVGDFALRQKPFQDNVLAVRFIWKLYGHIKDESLRETAEKTLSYLSDEAKLKEEGRFIGNYIMATEEYLNEPLHLLVLGSKSDPRAADLHKEALAYYAPHKILEWQDPKENPEIAKIYPAFDHPVIYVCGENRCSSPISKPEDLATATR